MSDRNQKSKRIGRPPKDPSTPAGRTSVLIAGRINPKVADAFTAYIDAFNRDNGLLTDKTAHLEKALVCYLHAMGVKIEGLPPYLQMLYGEEK